MNSFPVPVLMKSIATLLTEAYAGPPDPSATWFIDNEPDSGVLGIIASVSAADASRSLDGSSEPGTSIASHAEHLRWSLANMNAAIRGEEYGSWKESWSVKEADQADWDRLQSELRSEFELLRQALESQTELPEEYLIGVLALLPHAAYHLGNIRHMRSMLNA